MGSEDPRFFSVVPGEDVDGDGLNQLAISNDGSNQIVPNGVFRLVHVFGRKSMKSMTPTMSPGAMLIMMEI